MNTWLQDVRYGVRVLMKSPGFTLVAALALALGIGANTAIFSVVSAVLLRPLSFPEPDRLMSVKATNLKSKDNYGGVSPADFFDWQRQSESFERLACITGGAVTLTGADQPEFLPGLRVSREFFEVFGLRPLLGRTFVPEEFKVTGAGAAVMLSHKVWQRRFGGDPAIVGKNLTLNGASTTVVGVMPPEFAQPAFADVWRPYPEDSSESQLRGNRYFTVIGRLKPGVTIEGAQAEMETITRRLEAEHPQSNTNWSARVVSLKESLVGDVRSALLILLGAVLFVLAVACANVANLLLARATARQKEIAIRSALGASRWRVVRGLLVESVLLACLGGAAGLVFAWWGVDALKAFIPAAMRFPRLAEISIDESVLGFTLLVSVLTGIIFGLVPGLHASQPDLQESLKESGKSLSGGLRSQRARGVLIVSQVALTLLLLVGAGLLIRSFVGLQRTLPGFDSQNLVTFTIGAPKKYKPLSEESAIFFKQVSQRIENTPGVSGVASTSGAPLSGFILAFPFTIEGAEAANADTPQATYSSVSPNYFRVMGIPVRAGREFTERDTKQAPRVAVINETMARRFFPAGDAIGHRLKIDYLSAPTQLEIIGIAADVKQTRLDETPEIAMYVSYLQLPWFSNSLVVRTKVDPQSTEKVIKEAVWSLNPDQPVTIQRMDQLLGESIAQPRLYTLLLGAFAFVALALAAVGLYGVVSYTVAQRTHEIGIRMALGAQKRDVLRLVVRQGMVLVLIGVGIGVAASLALTRVLAGLLYGVSTTDPATFAGVAALLTVVALLACYIPARRATKVDPGVALRYE